MEHLERLLRLIDFFQSGQNTRLFQLAMPFHTFRQNQPRFFSTMQREQSPASSFSAEDQYELTSSFVRKYIQRLQRHLPGEYSNVVQPWSVIDPQANRELYEFFSAVQEGDLQRLASMISEGTPIQLSSISLPFVQFDNERQQFVYNALQMEGHDVPGQYVEFTSQFFDIKAKPVGFYIKNKNVFEFTDDADRLFDQEAVYPVLSVQLTHKFTGRSINVNAVFASSPRDIRQLVQEIQRVQQRDIQQLEEQISSRFLTVIESLAQQQHNADPTGATLYEQIKNANPQLTDIESAVHSVPTRMRGSQLEQADRLKEAITQTFKRSSTRVYSATQESVNVPQNIVEQIAKEIVQNIETGSVTPLQQESFRLIVPEKVGGITLVKSYDPDKGILELSKVDTAETVRAREHISRLQSSVRSVLAKFGYTDISEEAITSYLVKSGVILPVKAEQYEEQKQLVDLFSKSYGFQSSVNQSLQSELNRQLARELREGAFGDVIAKFSELPSSSWQKRFVGYHAYSAFRQITETIEARTKEITKKIKNKTAKQLGYELLNFMNVLKERHMPLDEYITQTGNVIEMYQRLISLPDVKQYAGDITTPEAMDLFALSSNEYLSAQSLYKMLTGKELERIEDIKEFQGLFAGLETGRHGIVQVFQQNTKLLDKNVTPYYWRVNQLQQLARQFIGEESVQHELLQQQQSELKEAIEKGDVQTISSRFIEILTQSGIDETEQRIFQRTYELMLGMLGQEDIERYKRLAEETQKSFYPGVTEDEIVKQQLQAFFGQKQGEIDPLRLVFGYSKQSSLQDLILETTERKDAQQAFSQIGGLQQHVSRIVLKQLPTQQPGQLPQLSRFQTNLEEYRQIYELDPRNPFGMLIYQTAKQGQMQTLMNLTKYDSRYYYALRSFGLSDSFDQIQSRWLTRQVHERAKDIDFMHTLQRAKQKAKYTDQKDQKKQKTKQRAKGKKQKTEQKPSYAERLLNRFNLLSDEPPAGTYQGIYRFRKQLEGTGAASDQLAMLAAGDKFIRSQLFSSIQSNTPYLMTQSRVLNTLKYSLPRGELSNLRKVIFDIKENIAGRKGIDLQDYQQQINKLLMDIVPEGRVEKDQFAIQLTAALEQMPNTVFNQLKKLQKINTELSFVEASRIFTELSKGNYDFAQDLLASKFVKESKGIIYESISQIDVFSEIQNVLEHYGISYKGRSLTADEIAEMLGFEHDTIKNQFMQLAFAQQYGGSKLLNYMPKKLLNLQSDIDRLGFMSEKQIEQLQNELIQLFPEDNMREIIAKKLFNKSESRQLKQMLIDMAQEQQQQAEQSYFVAYNFLESLFGKKFANKALKSVFGITSPAPFGKTLEKWLKPTKDDIKHTFVEMQMQGLYRDKKIIEQLGLPFFGGVEETNEVPDEILKYADSDAHIHLAMYNKLYGDLVERIKQASESDTLPEFMNEIIDESIYGRFYRNFYNRYASQLRERGLSLDIDKMRRTVRFIVFGGGETPVDDALYRFVQDLLNVKNPEDFKSRFEEALQDPLKTTILYTTLSDITGIKYVGEGVEEFIGTGKFNIDTLALINTMRNYQFDDTPFYKKLGKLAGKNLRYWKWQYHLSLQERLFKLAGMPDADRLVRADFLVAQLKKFGTDFSQTLATTQPDARSVQFLINARYDKKKKITRLTYLQKHLRTETQDSIQIEQSLKNRFVQSLSSQLSGLKVQYRRINDQVLLSLDESVRPTAEKVQQLLFGRKSEEEFVQEALSVASEIRGTDAFNQLKKLEFLNMLYQSTSHGEYQPKTVLRYLALNLLEKTETEEDARKLYRFLNTQLGELTSFETISKTKTVFDIITEGVGQDLANKRSLSLLFGESFIHALQFWAGRFADKEKGVFEVTSDIIASTINPVFESFAELSFAEDIARRLGASLDITNIYQEVSANLVARLRELFEVNQMQRFQRTFGETVLLQRNTAKQNAELWQNMLDSVFYLLSDRGDTAYRHENTIRQIRESFLQKTKRLLSIAGIENVEDAANNITNVSRSLVEQLVQFAPTRFRKEGQLHQFLEQIASESVQEFQERAQRLQSITSYLDDVINAVETQVKRQQQLGHESIAASLKSKIVEFANQITESTSSINLTEKLLDAIQMTDVYLRYTGIASPFTYQPQPGSQSNRQPIQAQIETLKALARKVSGQDEIAEQTMELFRQGKSYDEVQQFVARQFSTVVPEEIAGPNARMKLYQYMIDRFVQEMGPDYHIASITPFGIEYYKFEGENVRMGLYRQPSDIDIKIEVSQQDINLFQQLQERYEKGEVVVPAQQFSLPSEVDVTDLIGTQETFEWSINEMNRTSVKQQAGGPSIFENTSITGEIPVMEKETLAKRPPLKSALEEAKEKLFKYVSEHKKGFGIAAGQIAQLSVTGYLIRQSQRDSIEDYQRILQYNEYKELPPVIDPVHNYMYLQHMYQQYMYSSAFSGLR